jgi:outer membrane protein TolC
MHSGMNKARWLTGGLLAAWIRVPGLLSAQRPEALSLKEALGLALQNSHEVAEAEARYDVAANAARMNASTFHPSLYAGSGAAYTYGFPQTPGGAAPSIVALSYLQTLFNTSARGQHLAAEERTQVQSLELEKTRNAVTVRTSAAYLELGKVRHSLDLARRELEGSRRILDFTRQRVSEGLELPIEVTRGELAEARLKQRVVQLEGQETVVQRELAALLGLPSDQRIEVDSAPLSLSDQQHEKDLIDRALVTNLDLRQAEHERLAHEHVVAGEEGMKWPTVDLFGWYGLFARYNNFQAYYQRFQQHNFNIGLQVRIPIVSGQRSATVALAESELTLSEMEEKETRQRIELEVARQYQRLRELEAAREVARLEVKVAQENVQVLQARFEEGRSNLRDIERARLEENDKWLDFLNADYDRQKAQLELLNLTGDLDQLFR